MRKSWLALLFLIAGIKGVAQQADSITTTPLPDTILVLDSAEAKKGLFAFFSKDYPNPRKAALLSLIVPGGGQLYNKRWWKVPLVYGALGGMVAAINYNQSRYRLYRTAYIQKLNMEVLDEPALNNFSASTLRLARDRADKNTQLSYIGVVVVYALQAVEAFVDAHLKTFDVNEDLSLQLKPNFQTDVLTGQSVGIGLVLQFK